MVPLRAGDLLKMKGRRFLEAKSSIQSTFPTHLNGSAGESGGEGASFTTPNNRKNFSASVTSTGGSKNSRRSNDSDFSFSRFFGFGSSSSGSKNSTPSSSISGSVSGTPYGRSYGNNGRSGSATLVSPVPQPRILANVLFVQSAYSLVIVESTPKSIADDCYRVLLCAPWEPLTLNSIQKTRGN